MNLSFRKPSTRKYLESVKLSFHLFQLFRFFVFYCSFFGFVFFFFVFFFVIVIFQKGALEDWFFFVVACLFVCMFVCFVFFLCTFYLVNIHTKRVKLSNRTSPYT